MTESELIKFIESNLNHERVGYFSCVLLHRNLELLAWYAALRIGEIIKEFYINKISDILLCLKMGNLIQILNKMRKNDILLLSVKNPNFKSISGHVFSEVLNNHRNIVFIRTSDNSDLRKIKDITINVSEVEGLNEKLHIFVNINERGKKKLNLSMPDKSLISKYHNRKRELLEETIKKPKMDLV